MHQSRLKKYGGAAKEMIPRLRETILAMRKGNEAEPWNGRLEPGHPGH